MVEITYTQGPRNLNWPDVLKGAKQERAYFYDTVDDEGIERSAGWLCLSIEVIKPSTYILISHYNPPKKHYNPSNMY
jgi:hypothetical protein